MKPVLRSARQDLIKAKVEAEIARARDEAKQKKQVPTGFNERRTSVRVAVRFPATYGKGAISKAASGGKRSAAFVTEISRSGLRFLLAEELTIGISLEIDIKLGARFSHPLLHVEAKVVRLITETEHGYEYGLRIGADPAGRTAIGAAVLQLTLHAR